jgi:hypothetical protein
MKQCALAKQVMLRFFKSNLILPRSRFALIHLISLANLLQYGELVHFFYRMHDPTTMNKQGNDAGTQYRSVIFYHTPEQQKVFTI